LTEKLGFSAIQKNGILLYSAHWLYSPPILLPSAYNGLFPQVESGRAVELYLRRLMRSYCVIFNEWALTNYFYHDRHFIIYH